MYSSAGGSGTVAWGGATSWSNTSAFSGGSLNTTWVNGMDAVFEPWQDGGGNWQGGTVTVSSNVTSVNSINFNTSWLTGNYTITSGNGSTITLTGDAIINVGAGTNGIDLMQGDQDSNPGYVGGGTATIACTLAGTSGMYKAGAGTLILTGSNTYLNNADHTKDTIIGGGTLQIGNGGTTGDLAGNVSNSANMAFYRTDSSGYVFGGTISGTGSVDILGGKTIFTANHNYTGLTTIDGGATLQLGNNTSTGSIVGDVVDNGTLAFNRSDTLTYAGKIYGTGGVTQAGSGTTVLSGSNTYSGATNINAGVLSVRADSNLGTGSSIVFGGGTLQIAGTSAFSSSKGVMLNSTGTINVTNSAGATFSGVIGSGGSAGMYKAGAGTLILTGTNTYTGLTTISGGTLQIGNGGTTGDLAGNVSDSANMAFYRTDSAVTSSAAPSRAQAPWTSWAGRRFSPPTTAITA